MDVHQTEQEIDAYLFGTGLTVGDYFMDGEIIGYKANGRVYDLHFNHEGLAAACRTRLIALGIRRLP